MPRSYINPEHERLLLSILVRNNNKPMRYQVLGEIARGTLTDLTNTKALSTLRQSVKFRCSGGEYYCLSGR